MNNPFDNQDVRTYKENTFGESVRLRREQLGMTVRGMASEVGMSPIYLSDIERGKRPAPSGIISGKDYLTLMSERLNLTEQQKRVFNVMAMVSSMAKARIMGDYFSKNLKAMQLFAKAIQEGWDNSRWEKLLSELENN